MGQKSRAKKDRKKTPSPAVKQVAVPVQSRPVPQGITPSSLAGPAKRPITRSQSLKNRNQNLSEVSAYFVRTDIVRVGVVTATVLLLLVLTYFIDTKTTLIDQLSELVIKLID